MSAQYPSDFLKAIDFVLREEVGPFAATGGYISPDKAASIGDPGGETKWGIAKNTYPHLDIAMLTRDDAIAIYFRDYWLTTRTSNTNHLSQCAALNWPLNFAHLDCTVNIGNRKMAQDGTPLWTGRANAILQRAVGVEDDGYIGPMTLSAADVRLLDDLVIARRSPVDLALKAIAEREKYYRSRGAWADGFKKGWLARTARLLKAIAGEDNT